MKVSVIIPCRNEKTYIIECLEAIYACDLPERVNLAVFLVDGMSDDGTREVVRNSISRFPGLRIIDNTKQLTPYAFNLGVYADKEADYIQIVGARHILSKNYLRKCIEKLQNDPNCWCVGGRIINEYMNDTGSVISKAMSTTFGMGLGNFRTLNESCYTDTVTSPMYPSWVFEKVGYFDEDLIRNQDDDFNFRVTQAGGKIWYENDISLRYYVRGNYQGLWRQFYQYGYWKVYVNKKHKSVTTLRQLVPPLFVAYLALWLLSAVLGLGAFTVSSFPLILYLILAAYFALKVSKQSTEWFPIFKTFPILHISYGLGYLKGMWDFLVRNNQPSDRQKRLSR